MINNENADATMFVQISLYFVFFAPDFFVEEPTNRKIPFFSSEDTLDSYKSVVSDEAKNVSNELGEKESFDLI